MAAKATEASLHQLLSMKIGLLREEKTPPDFRVPLTPRQCAGIVDRFPLSVIVQPSQVRCFTDEMYRQLGIPVQEDLTECDVLLGIKEMPVECLLPGKVYCFFSHTIKRQSYNRELLRHILELGITLVDYETVTDEQGQRLLAFGQLAGLVGAHNALWTFGKRTGAFALKRMFEYRDPEELQLAYSGLSLPAAKVVLTGTGRVGKGARQSLRNMGLQLVDPEAFLHQTFNKAVFTQLTPQHYVRRRDGAAFNNRDFYAAPALFRGHFQPFFERGDLMINGINWNPKGPAFFSRADMRSASFKFQVIADISCDIAPNGSIPATLRATTIQDPVMGFDPITGREIEPYRSNGIDVMSIDNLPSEVPARASEVFGELLIQHLIPELIRSDSQMIERATIVKAGRLMERFEYLSFR